MGTDKNDTALPSSFAPVLVTKAQGSVQQLSVSGSHVCALVAGSQLSCWGYNYSGQTNSGGLSSVLQVAVGSDFTCARLAGGKVQCWGANNQGQLGIGSTGEAQANGTVLGSQTATHLSAGASHACVVREVDKVACWGFDNNEHGKIGIDWKQKSVPSPATVPGLPPATAVFAGQAHTCAITSTGEPWCWGQNTSGQLGDGTTNTTESWKPRKVAGWSGKATWLELSEHFSCALRDDGKAFCWGSPSSGIIGDGSMWKQSPVLVKGLP